MLYAEEDVNLVTADHTFVNKFAKSLWVHKYI